MTTIRAIALFALLPLTSRADGLAADAKKLFDKAESIELLSLDPKEKDKPTDGFHGYEVLGSVKLEKRADRETMLKAFYKGIADSDGTVAACFIPRHGLRATVDGKRVEAVICFQCLSMKVYVDGKASSALTTGKPAETFNAILRANKVPLPK